MKIILLIIVAIIVIALMPILAFKTTLFHFEPTMTLDEFHKRFDEENIVKHFKSAYPENFAGWGKSAGMITPAWGYGAVNGSSIVELRVEENFGKYEFVYTCGAVSEDVFPYVMIKNPSIEDINNNPCW